MTGATVPVRRIEIVREFSAAPEVVWAAWTTPRALLRWYGPVDWPAADIRADIRPGGAWEIRLENTSGIPPLRQSGRYVVVQAPERLEFTFRWDGDNHEDAAGIEMYVIVILEQLSNGGTRMHFSQSGPFSFASGENHRAGWDSTFTRLRHDLFED